MTMGELKWQATTIRAAAAAANATKSASRAAARRRSASANKSRRRDIFAAAPRRGAAASYGETRMAADHAQRLPGALMRPQISLLGEIEESAVNAVIDGLAKAEQTGDVAIEVTTLGGDAE